MAATLIVKRQEASPPGSGAGTCKEAKTGSIRQNETSNTPGRASAWGTLSGRAAAQQAAEKALKALHLYQGTVVWGHSVFELLDGLLEGQRPATDLLDGAKVLDRSYIPSRYANAHPSGPPYQYYTRADADQAVSIAEEVVTYCERQILQAE